MRANLGKMVHTSKSKAFVPPTLDQVQKYFATKGVTTNEPLKFFLHYESNGWMVGRAKMRSWRAAVAGWVLRMQEFQKQVPQQAANVGMDTSAKSDEEKRAEEAQIRRAYKNQRTS